MELNGGARDLLFRHREILTSGGLMIKRIIDYMDPSGSVAEWLREDPLIRELYDGIKLGFML